MTKNVSLFFLLALLFALPLFAGSEAELIEPQAAESNLATEAEAPEQIETEQKSSSACEATKDGFSLKLTAETLGFDFTDVSNGYNTCPPYRFCLHDGYCAAYQSCHPDGVCVCG